MAKRKSTRKRKQKVKLPLGVIIALVIHRCADSSWSCRPALEVRCFLALLKECIKPGLLVKPLQIVTG